MADINPFGEVKFDGRTMRNRVVILYLPDRQVKLIASKGIPVSEVGEVNSPGSYVKLYCISGADLSTVANLLHYTQEQVSLEEIEGNELFCRVAYQSILPQDYNYGGDPTDTSKREVYTAIKDFTSYLAALIKQNIYYYNTHGRHPTIPVDSCPHFVITSFGTSDGFIYEKSIPSLYGISLRGGTRDCRRRISNVGLEFSDGSRTYGDLDERGFNFWFDLPHSPNQDFSFLSDVLLEFQQHFQGNVDFETAQYDRLIERLKEYFVSIPQRKLNTLKEELDELSPEIKEVRDRLHQKYLLQAQLSAEYSALVYAKEPLFDVDKSIKDVVELIDKSPDLIRLYVEGNYLVVDTEDIFITHPKTQEVYYLGKFSIKINPMTGDVLLPHYEKPPMRRRNVSITHPHVMSYDDPCWGNIGSTLFSLINKGDFVHTIHLIMNYLRHVNGHLGELTGYWYTVKELKEKGFEFKGEKK